MSQACVWGSVSICVCGGGSESICVSLACVWGSECMSLACISVYV